MKQHESQSPDCLLAGWGRVEIPIHSGAPLAGYAPVRLCTGTHDPLYARVLVIEQAGKRQILVHLDLLAADEHFCGLIQKELEKDGFAFDELIVHAIHIHSAPAGFLDTREGVLKAARPFAAKYNPEQSESLARLITETIEKTIEHLRPCAVRIGDGVCENVASNRVSGKDQKKDADERMTLIEVRQKSEEDGEEHSALFVFFGCHPTVLDASNTLASADLFGMAARKLEVDQKADLVFMMNKACGDLSCRYTRQKSGFEECERLAGLLATAAKTIELRPARAELFAFSRLKTEVRAADVPDEKLAVQELEKAQSAWRQREKDCPAAKERSLRLAMEKSQVRLAAAKGKDDAKTRTIEFLVGRWNDRNIILAPGELFYTLSQKEHLPLLKNALILGNTNGYQLYMADSQAYETESYEALSSPFARGEMEKVMRQLEELLETFKEADYEELEKLRMQERKTATNEALGYLHYLEDHLEKVVNPQSETIEQAARLCEDSLKKDKRIYAFGSGHSAMVAEELCARAGGLAAMKPMVPDEVWAHNMPRKSTYLERIEGYGQALCRLYRIEQDDTVIVISNSGRNALPIDVASFAKKCGAHVIAITSLKHSRSVSSRHSSGKKLYEIADVVLDNGADPGDAGYYAKGCPIPVGPTSSITGMALGQAMVAQIASDLYLLGKEIPIFKSSNLDGADAYNDEIFDAYHNYWR